MKNQKLLLVDGSSYIFRAYYTPSLSQLVSPDGVPSGTLFGFNRTISLLLDRHKPTHCCVVFDPKGKTQRNKLYPDYKSNRPATPVEIKRAYDDVIILLELRGIATLQVQMEEADDVLGSLAYKFESLPIEILIATEDKDLSQLVTKNTRLINLSQSVDKEIGIEDIKEKHNVSPDLFSDYLALMGDSADNIPGIPGIGKKRSALLVNQYGGVEEIIRNHKEIPGKIGEEIGKGIDQLRLYHQLTQINKKIPVECDLNDLEQRQITSNKKNSLINFYEKMGFLGEIRKLDEGVRLDFVPKKPQINLFQAHKEIDNYEIFLEKIKQRDKEKKSFFVPFFEFVFFISFDPFVLSGISKNELKKISCESIEGTEGEIYSFDWRSLAHSSNWKRIPSNAKDLQIMGYLLNGGVGAQSWDLFEKEARLNGWIPNEPVIVTEKDKKEGAWSAIALEAATAVSKQYEQLSESLGVDFKKNAALLELYETLEKPLVDVLYQIERVGVRVDLNVLKQIDKKLRKRISVIQEDIYETVETPLNLDSPRQIAELLYDRLQIPVQKKTPKGGRSTDEKTLSSLADKGYGFATKILEYRRLTKLVSTYSSGLVRHIKEDQRIHTKLNQTTTSTGRLSSSSPNLQNIPIKDEEGRDIRKAFVAREGYQLLSLDYSQIELRALAHQSQDEGLITAFNQEEDIHETTARHIFHVPKDIEVDNTMRRRAKTINFGLIYGMSSFSLAKQLKISPAESKNWVEAYFDRFSKIKQYMEGSKLFAKEYGWVTTPIGRKIRIPNINARNAVLRQHAERVAINAPIQGFASDIMKLAMIEIHREIKDSEDIVMILQIHDELLFEVKIDRVGFYEPLIRKKMEHAFKLDVPLVVSTGVAENWADSH